MVGGYHHISTDRDYISFHLKRFNVDPCNSVQAENLVEICPNGVQLIVRAISIRKENHQLMKEVNQIDCAFSLQAATKSQSSSEILAKSSGKAEQSAVQVTPNHLLFYLLFIYYLFTYLLILLTRSYNRNSGGTGDAVGAWAHLR